MIRTTTWGLAAVLIGLTAGLAGAHTVNVDVLNVRSGPGFSYSIIGTLSRGTVVNTVSTSGAWTKINSPKTGWVYSSYLSNTSHTSSGSYVIRISSSELNLLERTVMAEAGGEPYLGQVAVAAVVINRVQSRYFPNTVYGVLTQPWQFTAVTTGAIWRKTPTLSVKRAVQEALRGADPSRYALYYYAWRIIRPPSWVYSKTYTVTIGGHKFYK